MAGATESNDCPAGSVRIETEAACRTALAAWGRTMGPSISSPIAPRGCSFYSDFSPTLAKFGISDGLFNPDPVGMGSATYQLLCDANGTTGALQPHRCAPARATAPRVCVRVAYARARDCACVVRARCGAVLRRHAGRAQSARIHSFGACGTGGRWCMGTGRGVYRPNIGRIGVDYSVTPRYSQQRIYVHI
jgi:hypothetical protein